MGTNVPAIEKFRRRIEEFPRRAEMMRVEGIGARDIAMQLQALERWLAELEGEMKRSCRG